MNLLLFECVPEIVSDVVLLRADAFNKVRIARAGVFAAERTVQHVDALHAVSVLANATWIVEVEDVWAAQIVWAQARLIILHRLVLVVGGGRFIDGLFYCA